MEIKYNVTGTNRKELVNVISKATGMKAVYKFMPTCNFEIGCFTVNKEGRLAVCPLCGRAYHGAPALSREDNKTLICPDCGTRQALASIGIEASEQEQILETIHRHTQR